LSDPERIRNAVRARLVDRRNTVCVSVASAWEIEIKRAQGKLRIPDDLDERTAEAGFTDLPIRLGHVRALRRLPEHHRDPFDRILVAQAIAEGLARHEPRRGSRTR
jgi:PIN domain nuclease of toxin-antitoxin system